jgi:membrane protein
MSEVPATAEGTRPAARRRWPGGGWRRKPKRFGDLPRGAWGRIARRTFDHARSDGVTNLAAALTYRAVLSLFPGLIALVALLGVLGQYPATFNAVLEIVGRFAPHSTVQAIQAPLAGVIKDKGGAGALLGVGLAGALWAASGYIGTFSWAANVMWEAKRGRSWYRQWPFDVAVTLVATVLLTAILLALVLTGPVAASVGQQLGIGADALHAWNVAKWPVLVVIVTLMISGLYYIAPNVRPPSPKWLTPGAIFAVVVWVATSFAFGEYVVHFNSYNRTYGTLGAIITFLVWVWLTNIAMLLGIELDSEIERERELVAGIPGAQERIDLPLRQS